MKNWLSISAAVIAMMILMTACGAADRSGSDPVSASESETATVSEASETEEPVTFP